MPDSEFDFVDNTFLALCEREERRGSESVTEIERVVLLVWHALGIVGNGGFRYFFECGLPLQETADAYTRIGVDGVAATFYCVRDLFPRQHIPDDYDKRMVIVEGFCERDGALVSQLESEFYRADAIVKRQLAGWIRVHKDLFAAADAV